MSDELTPTPAEPIPAPQAEPAAPAAEPTPEWLPSRLERQERAVLRDLGFDGMTRDQAREAVAAANAARAELDERRTAEMSDLEKERERSAQLAAELEAIKGQNAQAALDALKERVASAHGIPAAFASRLTGTTEEELTADAKTLLSGLPKMQDTPPPPPAATDQALSPEQLANLSPDEYAKLRADGRI